MKWFHGVAGGIALLAALSSSATENSLAQGRAIYNFRCYFCHGYSGDAKTLAATYLSPPPADFQAASPERINKDSILSTLRQGRPGTAMKSFANVLSPEEMDAVARFVMDEFILRKAGNTRYHTPENGWDKHERYAAAYPFALKQISLSQPWETLTPAQAEGKRLYLSSCVSCHDRGAPTPEDVAWDARPLSYPRNNFSLAAPPPKLDAMASASPYALHDLPPKISGMTAQEKRGESLFQANCAFCHGADGTGKNWIGQFLEPHPRNLQDPAFMANVDREHLTRSIREGLPGSSMPAWKSVLKKRDVEAILAYINRAFHPLRAQ
ncbi:c-type cytochrome [Denitratisoma oestradiolicum]|uniref:Cytochrome c class I n=1 Tax=Denitratisoma oestradiolicum TaxID=311182 RepID=A0A6S6YIZ0_9PROT|nr:c-type cytochrome [Denitratisoma oestradiolicum]TWO80625.1 cytochrome c class I [Denitratisoma oestradiolicum]CAB1367704.1 Cytochrome c class I [Denitratisoma oestradiolicum]